jgi:hypothetical protein
VSGARLSASAHRKLTLDPFRYLDDPRFKTTFESAHSFVLAVFASQKRVCKQLAPYYIELLLRSFPGLLTEGQFHHAYTTIVDTLSDRDDASAWWALTKLSDDIDNRRLKLKGITSDANAPSSTAVVLASEKEQSPSPQMNEAAVLEAQEKTYIAQLSHINLSLLRSTLSKVRAFINEADRAKDTAKKMALCECTFDALALLDASTREEGLRWWTEHRAEFGV